MVAAPSLNPTLRRALAVLLFAASFLLVFWVNYSTLANGSGRMVNQDFMSLWAGGKAIATGVNPYDIAVWRPLRASYGSRLLHDTIAPFPMWTLIFFVPFSFLTVRAAAALWITICEVSLIAGIFILARYLGWKDRAPFMLLLGTIIFRPLIPTLTEGQLSPVLLLLLVATYILYHRGHCFAAGFLLALQIVKPNLALFLILTAGWIFLTRRDWGALAGLVAGGLVLLVASWIALPGWLFQYFETAEKTRATHRMPTLWGLTHVMGGAQLWPASAVTAGVILFAGLLYFIWKQRREDWRISFNLAVIAATFLTPYAWNYEQLILILPNTVALRWGLASRRGSGWVWWTGWWLVGPVMSWLFFLYALQRGLDVISGFIPVLSLGYLVLAWLASERTKPSSALTTSGDLATV